MERDDIETLATRYGSGTRPRSDALLSLIAKDIYERPRVYGLRSAEDAGELFDEYWNRIAGLVDRYRDVGSSFRAYLVTSIRYMALSIRRKKARRADIEAVYAAELGVEYEAALRDEQPVGVSDASSGIEIPAADDTSPEAKAFRRRVLFICLKSVNALDDDKAVAIARRVGLDEERLLELLRGARNMGLGVRRRTASRRRGRDAAWLRMAVNGRRLERETDAYKKQCLSAAIERDRGLYGRVVHLISRSGPTVSNQKVAHYLGVPKGTVDCGVGRIVRRYGCGSAEEGE